MNVPKHTHTRNNEKENADQREFPIKVNFIMKPANIFKMYDCLNHTGALSTIDCITGFFFLLQNCYVVFVSVCALVQPIQCAVRFLMGTKKNDSEKYT